STATGAKSSSTCIKCPAGTYGAKTGLTECTKCGAGTYSTATGAIAETLLTQIKDA
ncbi:MAG: hypothetical protein II368_00470, partial [Clostridia bacterium]|nr:hypothetical protein [Clostridia bacterium]